MRDNKENSIIIGYSKLKISLPIFVAKERKLFEKYKIPNVELREYDTAQSMINDLVSHKIHLGGYSALPIAFSAMKTMELLFIGGIYESNEYPISFLLVNKNNSEIKCISDLKGKKIGILPTKAYKIWINTILGKEGIKLSEITLIELEVKKHLTHLRNGHIDVLFTNDPMASEIIDKGIGIRLSDEALVPKATGINPFYFGSFNVTKLYAEEHKNIVKKITLALDEAILLIAKNPYLVNQCLIKYLTNKDSELAKKFTKKNYKTSKNVSNYDLKIMQLYYYQQNLYKDNMLLENSQYQIITWQYRVGKLRDIINDFITKHRAIGSFLFTIGTIVSSFWYFNNESEQRAKEYRQSLIDSRKSQQAQFEIEYGSVDTYTEAIRLVNIGYSALKNVKMQMEVYFISKENTLYSSSTIPLVLYKNITLLKAFKDEGILNKSKDYTLDELYAIFDGWFDTKEVELVKLLQGNAEKLSFSSSKTIKNKIDLPYGSSSRNNAFKLNQIFKMKIIMRVKIKYNEEVSGKSRIATKYIWIENKANKIIRRDLENVYGGKRIIKAIRKYEENTQDIIFSY